MTSYSLSQIQQLEMKLHKISDRLGRIESENQQLKQRVVELEKQQEKTEA